MEGYKVRFEHGRGHRMVLEGEPPIGSGEIDAIQYRMLRNCEIPGLLALETEELDGVVALRYSLSGRRMLSQTLRSARWTMEDALTALCRLAEVLEMSREYMLDLERYVLDDDYIFTGEGWHDMALTYLPLWRQTASVFVASGMEKLIVRWMMNVDSPDGLAMQQLLRIAASPDFSPAQLRSYARQYLAGTAAPVAAELRQVEAHGRPSSMPEREAEAVPFIGMDRSSVEAFDSKPARSLNLHGQEAEGNSQGLSSWLGEEPLWAGDEERPEASSSAEASSRRRVWLLAGAAGVTAAVWRFAYLPHPNAGGLLFSLVITLLAAGACYYLWNGKKRRISAGGRHPAERAISDVGGAPQWISHSRPDPYEDEGIEAAPTAESLSAQHEQRPRRFGGNMASPLGNIVSNKYEYERIEPRVEVPEAGTSWLGAPSNGTRLLSMEEEAAAPQIQAYLEWEQDEGKQRIRLVGDSIVIGRSNEAAQHVDDTEGVSRAHLEVIRGADGWQARDLGSRNGSWLNGVPMAPYEMYSLSKGDSIQIASSLYRYGEGIKAGE